MPLTSMEDDQWLSLTTTTHCFGAMRSLLR